jgi:superfamily II DNA or RNA helicase
MINGGKLTIKVLSGAFCHISHPQFITDLLSFNSEYWTEGQFAKVKGTYRKKLVKKDGFFLTGFLEKVRNFLDSKNIPYDLIENEFAGYDLSYKKEPSLPGIDFRSDQLDHGLSLLIPKGRGVWEAPTGAGKSVLAGGVVDMFLNERVLVLVPTVPIFHQLLKDFKKWFNGEKIGAFGDGHREMGDIAVGIPRTVTKMLGDPVFSSNWGVVVIDEVHRVSNFTGDYYKILTKLNAPIRFGFTGTLPVKEEARMAMEGLVGPVVLVTKDKDLTDAGILAKPRIKILKTPKDDFVKEQKNYQNVYEYGIIKNESRGRIMYDFLKENIGDGTALIFVTKIRHALFLRDMALDYFSPNEVRLVIGGPPSDVTSELALVSKLKKQVEENFGRVSEVISKKKKLLGGMYNNTIYADLKRSEDRQRRLKEIMDSYEFDMLGLKEVSSTFRSISKMREQNRLDLEDGKFKVAIATTTWQLGVNIPSLGIVVNATSNKSPIMSVQFFGRGRRVTEEKKEALLVDFFDPSSFYLIDSFGERISLYIDKGWM